MKFPIRGRRPLRHGAAALVCVLAGLLFTTSADVSRGTDLRTDRGDLTDLVRREQERISAANARVRALREEVDSRTGLIAPTTSASSSPSGSPSGQPGADPAAQQRELAGRVGLEPLTGAGLTVVLDDAPASSREGAGADANPDDYVVHQQDVQAVVNALWAGGAQGVQLMDQRVISTSAVRCVGSTLLLQGRIYPPPYRIAAVGPVDRMLEALDVSPEAAVYRQYVDLVGLVYDLSAEPSLTLPAYDGSLGITRATVVKAGAEASTGQR